MAEVGQTIFVMSFITVICLTMVFSTYIYKEIEGPLDNSTFATNESRAAYDRFDASWSLFDKATIFIMVSLICGVLISAFVIPTHPIYVIGSVLVMAVEVFCSFVLSNAYYAITSQNAALQTIASTNYPFSSGIILHLPIWAIVLSTLNCIIMFSHGRSTQQYSNLNQYG